MSFLLWNSLWLVEEVLTSLCLFSILMRDILIMYLTNLMQEYRHIQWIHAGLLSLWLFSCVSLALTIWHLGQNYDVGSAWYLKRLPERVKLSSLHENFL